jgi:hemin uptake protein HemP
MIIICDMGEHTPPPQAPGPTPAGNGRRPPRRIASSELFVGARELVIDHDGRLYQLRITQNGKLILTA